MRGVSAGRSWLACLGFPCPPPHHLNQLHLLSLEHCPLHHKYHIVKPLISPQCCSRDKKGSIIDSIASQGLEGMEAHLMLDQVLQSKLCMYLRIIAVYCRGRLCRHHPHSKVGRYCSGRSTRARWTQEVAMKLKRCKHSRTQADSPETTAAPFQVKLQSLLTPQKAQKGQHEFLLGSSRLCGHEGRSPGSTVGPLVSPGEIHTRCEDAPVS